MNVTVLARLVRRNPATVLFAAFVTAFGLVDGFAHAFASSILLGVGTGFEPVVRHGQWWTPLTYSFFTDNLGELLVSIPAILLLVGFAERRLGTARMIFVGLVAAVVGAAAGIGIQAIGVANGDTWARDVSEFHIVDPFGFIAAVLLAASAYCGGIWRGRIRVVTIAVCAMYLLYSGEPSDLYRLVAACTGLIAGIVLRPHPSIRQWDRSTHHELRVLTATIVAITAFGPLLTLVSGRRYGLLAPLGLLMSGASLHGHNIAEECNPFAVTRLCAADITLLRLQSAGPVILVVMPLIVILLAAFGLARGRRLAAWLVIGINTGLAGLGLIFYGFLPLIAPHRLLMHPDPRYWELTLAMLGSILLPALIAIFVARNLRHFQVHSMPGKVPAYFRTVVIGFVALCALYVGGGWLIRNQFRGVVTFSSLVADLPDRFIPISFLRHAPIVFLPNSPLAGLLYNWVGPLFWIIVIGGAAWCYLDRGALNYSQELPRVRALLLRGGGGFLGQWATWRGNSYWFSDDGRASVAYRVFAGVAITTSEPIGDPEAAREAVTDFARYCDDRGWIPLFYAVHAQYMPAIRRMGWRSIVIGEEAVIRPQEWSTSGKHWQDIRSSINRAERSGIRAVWTRFVDLSPDWAAQITAISHQWVDGKALPEMGFTLGSLEELRSPDVGLMVACDEHDRIQGVTSWLPAYRLGTVTGWTLDFMRRVPDGMNGVMEFLIARAAERFRDEGAEFMSLSTAPLATSLEGAERTSTERALGWLAAEIEPMYGFGSLFRFKKKFLPELEPVYVAYPDALALPAIAIALVRAYLPRMTVRQALGLVFRRRHPAGQKTPATASAKSTPTRPDVLTHA